jgi:RsbT co-antagonist protein rsbRD N-terminal domain
MTTTQIPSSSINVRFADYLHSQRDSIISEWLERIQSDPTILPTETLNTFALKNHLPEIFDALTDTLRRYGCEAVAGQSVKDAEEHGATRPSQGYELPEMLRELKLLRAVLIFHLRAFDDQNPDDGMAARLFISTTLHGFLDEMAIDATEEYLLSQQSPQRRLALEQTKY